MYDTKNHLFVMFGGMSSLGSASLAETWTFDPATQQWQQRFPYTAPPSYDYPTLPAMAFDSKHGWETMRMYFLVNRPADEPGFRLVRQESEGRVVRYTLESDAVARAPEGMRYAG